MPSSGGASLEMAAALAVDPPRLMPTFEELRASSASVVFPQSITNGVDNHEFVRYDMDIPDAFQKYKLALDHYDNPKGLHRGEDMLLALESTVRLICEKTVGDLVTDAILRPYTKVLNRSNYHSLFLRLFICLCCVFTCCCCSSFSMCLVYLLIAII